MKARTGFVSNSSSSSFILQFPNKITDKNDLIILLGGDPTEVIKTCDWRDNYRTIEEIAEYIMTAISSEPLNKEQIILQVREEFSAYSITDKKEREVYAEASDYRWNGYDILINGLLQKYNLSHTNLVASVGALTEENRQLFTVQYSAAQMEYQRKLVEYAKVRKEFEDRYIPKSVNKFYNPKMFYYQGEFEDGDDIGSWVEHEGLEKFKVLRFSHH